MEREGIDLHNIFDQWIKQGIEAIPPDQLDHVQYIFLMTGKEKSRGIKCMHGEICKLGMKLGDT
jgi:hypothetical protein